MKIATILFLTLIGLTNISLAQINIPKGLVTKAEQTSGDKFPFTAKTKKGAMIFANEKPHQEMLNAIDKGLDDLFAIAKKYNYNSRTKHSEYVIFIAKPDRLNDSSGNYVPNFAIPVQQYAGTDYDKGGYMYAAGMVLWATPCAFMIAKHDKKFEQVSEVVRFEGEHLILYHNDRKRYNETADHSKGGSHPILQ